MGPLSREQPAVLQPVAAGPTKVGLESPRLDVLGAAGAVLAAVAAVAPTGAMAKPTIIAGMDKMDRSAALRIMLSFFGRFPATAP